MAEEPGGLTEWERIDTVAMVSKWLEKHPESCKLHSAPPERNDLARLDGRGGKTHDDFAELQTLFSGD